MIKRFLAACGLLFSLAAAAQTTTSVTGTIKDLTNTAVTSGQVTFELKPSLDTTISGSARFSPATVTCGINGAGAVKDQALSGTCTVTNNTSLTPSGTYYKVCIQPQFISPGSCFNWYALGTSTDITTVVPTPATTPAFSFMDLFATQTATGQKTFSNTANSFFGTLTGAHTSSTSNPAGSGIIRLATGDTACWRNNANSADVCASKDTSDLLNWNGVPLVTRTQTDTLTNKTLTSPVINGTTTGTGIPTVTAKVGSGSGNYTTSATSYADVDGTNLAYTVTVPTGWKADIVFTGWGHVSTTNYVLFAITDGTTVLREFGANPGANIDTTFSGQHVFTGDGASHTFKIRWKVSLGTDVGTLTNDTATRAPILKVTLTPSN
jgi:hypothetical protein